MQHPANQSVYFTFRQRMGIFRDAAFGHRGVQQRADVAMEFLFEGPDEFRQPGAQTGDSQAKVTVEPTPSAPTQDTRAPQRSRSTPSTSGAPSATLRTGDRTRR